MVNPIKRILILLGFATLTVNCQSAPSGSSLPIAVGALSHEYQKSRAVVRGRYDGKEITIRGFAAAAPTMPREGAEQGAVSLAEKDVQPREAVTCWFTREQLAEFSKVKGGQHLTVRGVFTGEAGAELKFCKLVEIE